MNLLRSFCILQPWFIHSSRKEKVSSSQVALVPQGLCPTPWKRELSKFCAALPHKICSVLFSMGWGTSPGWYAIMSALNLMLVCYTSCFVGEKVFMPNELPLKIYILAAEIVPFAKAGGMADVVGALPKALKDLGHDVRLVMPLYTQVKSDRFNLQPVPVAVPLPIFASKQEVTPLQRSTCASTAVPLV